jgi:hypothetical protein
LFQAVKANVGLTQVHVNNVDMSDEGAQDLHDCIKFNSTLHVLGLCKNGFTNRTANKILEALKVNSAIKEIELWGNDIDDDKKRQVSCVFSSSSVFFQSFFFFSSCSAPLGSVYILCHFYLFILSIVCVCLCLCVCACLHHDRCTPLAKTA